MLTARSAEQMPVWRLDIICRQGRDVHPGPREKCHLLPERLHFRGLLAALASKPVHILGGRPHHLVCLQLALVVASVHPLLQHPQQQAEALVLPQPPAAAPSPRGSWLVQAAP